ncbi:MAG: ArsC/Spx/MgsR family protein [Vicingaceae bacterium]
MLALAESNQVKATEQNIHKEKLTGTQLLTLSNKLKMSLDKMVDKESELYKNSLQNVNYDEADWVQVLTEHPELLKTPIVEKGSEIMIAQNPTDVLKFKDIDPPIDGHNHLEKK